MMSMMTNNDIAAMTDAELNEAVATEIMNNAKPKLPHIYYAGLQERGWRLLPINGGMMGWFPQPYASNMSIAWQVVERITRVPTTSEESIRADNTAFAYWFRGADLWCMTAQEAARAICENALRIVRRVNPNDYK